jgi:hypothetical protein
MDIQQRIDEARRQFAHSLVGCWSTAQGSFNAVTNQLWEIRPDGTGFYVDTGPFGYPNHESRFVWRQSQPFVFELRITEEIELEPEPSDEADTAVEDVDDEPCPWISIRYDFKAVSTDVGMMVGMVREEDLASDGGSFFWSLAPLAYDGPIET